MKQEPIPDERYELVCGLLEEVGFHREEIKVSDYGLTGTQQCMVYGNPNELWGEIIFRVGVDLKKRTRLFRSNEYFMKFSFAKGGLESTLRTSMKTVGCKKCFIMKLLEEPTPYLCVPIECYKIIPQIVKEYYRLDKENRHPTSEKQREKNKREVEEIEKQLKGECK